MKLGLCGAALAGALAVAGAYGAPANATVVASGPYFINYNINSQYPVSDLVLFESSPNSFGITFGGCCNGPITSGVITDPFEKTSPITDTFLMGVTSNLPGDAPGQQHLVLFTNDAFAQAAQNVAFGTLFPNSNETALITDITTDLDEAAVGETVYNQAVNDLFTFGGGDAVSGPNGNLAFAPGGAFTEVAFSNGQIIGNGVSFLSAAPEPSAWALLFLGVGIVGAGLRTRRKERLAAAV